MVGSIRAVLFDFDGVIADTETLHFQAFVDVFDEIGIRVTEEDYNNIYIALSDRDTIRAAFERAGRPQPRGGLYGELMRKKAERYEELAEKGAPLFPGVRECVERLSERLPVAIGSGALYGEIMAILNAHGIAHLFVGAVGADMVLNSKPDPETYLQACALINEKRGMNIDPRDCAVIEDTDVGIRAGKSAGMRALGVANTYPPERLKEADAVVDSLEGLTLEAMERLLSP